LERRKRKNETRQKYAWVLKKEESKLGDGVYI
jgi:hypothetical protein